MVVAVAVVAVVLSLLLLAKWMESAVVSLGVGVFLASVLVGGGGGGGGGGFVVGGGGGGR